MLNMEVTYSTEPIVKPQLIIGFYFQKVGQVRNSWGTDLKEIVTHTSTQKMYMYNVHTVYITCALYIFKLLILQHGLKSETIK